MGGGPISRPNEVPAGLPRDNITVAAAMAGVAAIVDDAEVRQSIFPLAQNRVHREQVKVIELHGGLVRNVIDPMRGVWRRDRSGDNAEVFRVIVGAKIEKSVAIIDPSFDVVATSGDDMPVEVRRSSG